MFFILMDYGITKRKVKRSILLNVYQRYAKFFPKIHSILAQRFMLRTLPKWNDAGILLTYWCNAKCAICYENCSPRRHNIQPVKDTRKYLRELKKLGFTGQNIHYTGGEPFYNYEHLIKCLEAANEEGMLPLGKLETNGFWCKSDELTRERLSEIKRLGVVKLSISSDVFHQEYIPIQLVQRAERIGKEILGENGVTVSSRNCLESSINVMLLSEDKKLELFQQVLKNHSWRITGRAVRDLSHLLEKYPSKTFADKGCASIFFKNKYIHIDPYGNIFPYVCAGIIIGNAKKKPLSIIHETFKYSEHPCLKKLAEGGSFSLLKEAINCGFSENEGGYASKCHLCFEVRTFFWKKGMYIDEIGPEEIYIN